LEREGKKRVIRGKNRKKRGRNHKKPRALKNPVSGRGRKKSRARRAGEGNPKGDEIYFGEKKREKSVRQSWRGRYFLPGTSESGPSKGGRGTFHSTGGGKRVIKVSGGEKKSKEGEANPTDTKGEERHILKGQEKRKGPCLEGQPPPPGTQEKYLKKG